MVPVITASTILSGLGLASPAVATTDPGTVTVPGVLEKDGKYYPVQSGDERNVFTEFDSYDEAARRASTLTFAGFDTPSGISTAAGCLGITGALLSAGAGGGVEAANTCAESWQWTLSADGTLTSVRNDGVDRVRYLSGPIRSNDPSHTSVVIGSTSADQGFGLAHEALPRPVVNAGLAAADSPLVTAKAGDHRDVPIAVEITSSFTSLLNTVSATAPEGLRFDPDQPVRGSYSDDGGTDWRHDVRLDFTATTIGDDGSTLTGTYSTTQEVPFDAGRLIRWDLPVVVVDDATVGSRTLNYTMTGGNELGEFHVESTSTLEVEATEGPTPPTDETPGDLPETVELVVPTGDGFAYVPQYGFSNDEFTGRDDTWEAAASQAQTAKVLANADGSFALWNDHTDNAAANHCFTVHDHFIFTAPGSANDCRTGDASRLRLQDGVIVRDVQRELGLRSTLTSTDRLTVRESGDPARFEGLNATPADEVAPIRQPVTLAAPADPAAGYTPRTSFTFTGTATPGATISIENTRGVKVATVTTDKTGTWSWTRANLGTSIWNLNFIQDIGTPEQTQAELRGFAPRR
jgi:hypothetical protein